MKLFVDYDLTPLPSRGSRERMNTLAAGGGVHGHVLNKRGPPHAMHRRAAPHGRAAFIYTRICSPSSPLAMHRCPQP